MILEDETIEKNNENGALVKCLGSLVMVFGLLIM